MTIQYTRFLQFSQQFGRFYARQFAPLSARTGLGMREIHVLLFLANNPGYDTAREISELRGISKSQVSQAVELLAAEGLLSRTPDAGDRRVVHLAIKPEGAPLARECQDIQYGCWRRLLEGFSEEQEARLWEMLGLIFDNSARLAEEDA